jgi:UDP-glucose 4-epimerase
MAPLSVLVTGSSGFIGTHVVRRLHAAGHRVTGLDHIPPKDPLPEGVAFHVCDIRRGDLPDRAFDAVVHLAALAGVRPSMNRPMEYEITNVIGTIRLLEFCRRMGIPRSSYLPLQFRISCLEFRIFHKRHLSHDLEGGGETRELCHPT